MRLASGVVAGRYDFRLCRADEIREAEKQGVPIRVNYLCPESNESSEMPPYLRLPQIPKQVKYRFVGRNLLLVDRENGLIIDYMTNAFH